MFPSERGGWGYVSGCGIFLPKMSVITPGSSRKKSAPAGTPGRREFLVAQKTDSPGGNSDMMLYFQTEKVMGGGVGLHAPGGSPRRLVQFSGASISGQVSPRS